MANPLDLQELQPFMRNMEKEMPIHTESTAKIKRSYSQGMPKNLMDYSAFVDNHFLNDNLAIIEEMSHRDSKHPIPKWFREYQIKHFAKSGILNKDRFFTSRMRDGYRKHFSADLTEIREIGSLPYSGTVLGFGTVVDSKVFGSTLTGGGTALHQHQNINYLYSIYVGSGTIGQYYNQGAINVNSIGSSPHERIGAYNDDGSNKPSILYAETASISSQVGFNWRSLTEFALTTARTYLAFQCDTTNDIWQDSSLSNSLHLQTYGAMVSTWSHTTFTTDTPNVKLGHT